MPFSDLKGQDRAVGLIRRVVESDQTSLTMLFTGPPGVGKVTAAGSLARLVNCEAPMGKDSCGACISCRRFDSGNHPDFEMIEAEAQFISATDTRPQSASAVVGMARVAKAVAISVLFMFSLPVVWVGCRSWVSRCHFLVRLHRPANWRMQAR